MGNNNMADLNNLKEILEKVSTEKCYDRSGFPHSTYEEARQTDLELGQIKTSEIETYYDVQGNSHYTMAEVEAANRAFADTKSLEFELGKKRR